MDITWYATRCGNGPGYVADVSGPWNDRIGGNDDLHVTISPVDPRVEPAGAFGIEVTPVRHLNEFGLSDGDHICSVVVRCDIESALRKAEAFVAVLLDGRW